MPYPIQSGSITDRLRKFFRIRGRTGFQLDEMVAPVVLVQDLTKGPYQAGVTPCAGQIRINVGISSFSACVLLNDKPGSLTPVLGPDFDNRSFSFTWAQILNIDNLATEMDDLSLELVKRADVIAAGVPVGAESLFSIQNNDGSLSVPVEIFTFPGPAIPGQPIWRGVLGDNVNTLGRQQTFEDIQPNITIGPEDALMWAQNFTPAAANDSQLNIRGFYQEQPA